MRASFLTQNTLILKQGEDGTLVAEIRRNARTSQQATYFSLKKECAALQAGVMRRLQQLVGEGAWLKKVVADLTLVEGWFTLVA
ncbi:transposase IS3 [Defluviimonas sp. 20V17]|uniref:Transposase n=1 Tax=Allgaiera indica TaxID=765699 RepID=A0AAN4UTE6_9RHOB|nr:hypothetical protein [Allgaiera indica]KDB05366.1 transposase IS3 [Defluviimonas sp. 20V17]GHE04172.1 hypothetical protein GCM10008024_30250 [Allgaiera indica]SDX50382.1 putative transposase [Allgaiera indica]